MRRLSRLDVKMSVQEGLGKVTAVCRALGRSIRHISLRTGQRVDSHSQRGQRKKVVRPSASRTDRLYRAPGLRLSQHMQR